MGFNLALKGLILIKCKLPEDGDNAETCRNYVIERIHKSQNRVFDGVTRDLINP